MVFCESSPPSPVPAARSYDWRSLLLVLAHPQPSTTLLANPGYRTKLLLFFVMALSFGYPSRLFHRWRRSLRQGQAPIVSTQQQLWVIWILRGNLLLLALLPLLARLASR